MSGSATPARRPVSATPVGSAPRQKFRLDIQGIRAIAVLLVVANHIAPGAAPGGYVGVDVFFVVSGYLITMLLVREGESGGHVSLARFYARRARRILPAATVVTAATVVGSLVVLPLIRAQTVLEDAVWATFFAANIRMATVGTDYFAQGQPPSPLRHYWSLAVEEQFYLVWPLLVLLCLVWIRRRTGGPGPSLRRTAGFLIAGIVVVTLAWSAWATYASPVTAYFSTFARAWELGIGAACALLPRSLRLPPVARQLLAYAGLGAVGLSVLVLSETTPYPGTAALLPVLGTAALIVAGLGQQSTVVGRALAVTPLVRVGDWSYSIYLWHWPLIVLMRNYLGPERFSSIPVRLTVLVLIFVLSWATYRWVETPFRAGRTWRRTGRALLIYPVSVAVSLATVVVGTQVISYRLGEWSHEPAITVAEYRGQGLGHDAHVALVRASVLAAKDGREVPSDLTPGLLDLRSQTFSLGKCDFRTGTRRLCPLGGADAERSIVVLGDSHARALAPGIAELGREHGYRVYALVYSGCMATDLEQIDRHTGRRWDDCESFKEWTRDTVKGLSPDLVVVSTHAGRVIDPATGDTLSSKDGERYLAVLEDGWTEYFEELDADAGRVYVVGNTPKLPRETGVCLSLGNPDLGDCTFRPGRYSIRQAEVSFDAAEAAGVGAVDALKWFCADNRCPSVVGSYITMRDSEHMTPDYSRWLAEPLAAELGVAETRNAEAAGAH